MEPSTIQAHVIQQIIARLHKLETYQEFISCVNYSHRIERLENIIKSLVDKEEVHQDPINEKMVETNDISISIEERLDEIEKWMARIENLITTLTLKVDLRMKDNSVSDDKQEENNQGHKKPHKCPVCDGSGICNSKENSLPYQCYPCDGKGILWG